MELSKESQTGKESLRLKTSRYNIGGADRTIRGILGISMMFAGLFLFDGFSLNHFGLWVMALSLIPMVTGQTAICPVYKLFGFSTRTARDEEKEAEYEENYEKDYH
ncbi:MAG: YgaP family membrane protein [Nitrospiria bacterium]